MKKRVERGNELRNVAVRDQIPSQAILDNLRRSAMRSANHRLSAGHRLEINQTEPLAAARQGENFTRRIAGRDLCRGKTAKKVDVTLNAVLGGQVLQPMPVIPFSDSHKLDLRPMRSDARQRRDEVIEALVSLFGVPSPDGKNHAPGWKFRRERRERRFRQQRFEVGIKRPRQHPDAVLRHALLRGNKFSRCGARCQYQVRSAQGTPADRRKRL